MKFSLLTDWLKPELSISPTFSVDDEPARPDARELGGTGTSIFGNILQEEDYNTDLNSLQRYNWYDKMRFGDGQVKAGLSVLKLPLLSATWTIQPADDSPLQKEMSERFQDELMNRSSVSWHDTLRHLLLMLDWGSMIFEAVWEIEGNRVVLHKLAPRMPRTVSKWLLDEHGGFAGIVQSIAGHAGNFQEIEIPSEKLVVFVNEREGSNYRGVSVLRPAFKHWYMKDRFYVIDAITQEKRGLGIDVAHLNGSNVTTAQRRQAELAMMTLRTHEKNFLVEPEWMTYRVEGVGRGATRDALPSIEHHDLRILRSMLTEFIAAQGGELSLGGSVEANSSFFLMALGSVGFNIEETVSRYLIPRWVKYNYGVQPAYPRLKHSRLDTRDNQKLADAVQKLVSVGVITPDSDLEASVREIFELPESMTATDMEKELRRRLARKGPNIKLANVKADVGFGPGVRLTGAGVRVDFGVMEDALDDGQDRIVKAVKAVQKRQIAKLVALATGILKSGNEERLTGLTVPFQDEIAKAVATELKKLYKVGQTEVKKELSSQGLSISVDFTLDPTDDEDVSRFMTLRARALTGVIADRLKSSVLWETLRQMRAGIEDEEALTKVLTDLSDREINKVASNTVSEALNLGRDAVAMRNAGRIERAEFSSVLDDGTCEPCSDEDGKTFTFGSAEYERHRPPYESCMGQGRCRCIFVFVLTDEEGDD